MKPAIDETHDLNRRSFIDSANDPVGDFPIQNLPFGIFSRASGDAGPGVAIGDQILDLRAAHRIGLLPRDIPREALAQESLNSLFLLGRGPLRSLRRALSALLSDLAAGKPARQSASDLLAPMSDCLHRPSNVANYTDFYAGIASSVPQAANNQHRRRHRLEARCSGGRCVAQVEIHAQELLYHPTVELVGAGARTHSRRHRSTHQVLEVTKGLASRMTSRLCGRSSRQIATVIVKRLKPLELLGIFRTIAAFAWQMMFLVAEVLVSMSLKRKTGAKKVQPRRTREERSEETRNKLIQAGARTVGRYGYEGASIARITARAKVALGTFYRHFKSRQEFFDQLLPAMGHTLMSFVQERVDRDVVGAAREEQRLRAYFEFLDEHPWYHRLLNESEVMAPKAHAVYFDLMTSGLVRSFQRSQGRDELRAFRREELETVAYIVMASRVYLAQRYAKSNGVVQEPPPDVLATYNKFIQRALFD